MTVTTPVQSTDRPTDTRPSQEDWMNGPLAGPDDFSPWLFRYSMFTAAATLFLLFVGGTVTTTAAGDSIPVSSLFEDIFRSFRDSWTGNQFYEDGHRVVARGVGLLIFGLAAWVWATQHRKSLRILAGICAVAVVAQGLLGGLRIFYFTEGPEPIISIVHTCFAQVIFCGLAVLCVLTSKGWLSSDSEPPDPKMRKMLNGALHLVFLQVVLGAFTRQYFGISESIADGALVLHIVGAIAVMLFIGFVAIRAQSYSILFIMVVQVGLGVATWLIRAGYDVGDRAELAGTLSTGKMITMTAHVPMGALLLGAVVALWMWHSPSRMQYVGDPS